MSDKTFNQPLGGHTAGRDQGYPEDLPRFREGFGFMTAEIFPELVSCCVALLPLGWRPFSCGVQHTKYPDLVAGDVVDQNIVLVGDKLPGAFYATRPAELWVIGQSAGFLLKQLIQGQRRCRIVVGNVFANLFPVLVRRSCPNQLQESVLLILLRVFSRQAAASASTSSAEMTPPALAASRPTCTCSRNQVSCSSFSVCWRTMSRI